MRNIQLLNIYGKWPKIQVIANFLFPNWRNSNLFYFANLKKIVSYSNCNFCCVRLSQLRFIIARDYESNYSFWIHIEMYIYDSWDFEKKSSSSMLLTKVTINNLWRNWDLIINILQLIQLRKYLTDIIHNTHFSLMSTRKKIKI